MLVSRASVASSEPSAFEDQGESASLTAYRPGICHSLSAHRQGATVWGSAWNQPFPHERWKLEDEYPGVLLLEGPVLSLT